VRSCCNRTRLSLSNLTDGWCADPRSRLFGSPFLPSLTLVLVHGLVTCRGRSSCHSRGRRCRGRCRSSCWYDPSPSFHQLGHFVHLLCSVCRWLGMHFRSFNPDRVVLAGAWLCGDWLHGCGCL